MIFTISILNLGLLLNKANLKIVSTIDGIPGDEVLSELPLSESTVEAFATKIETAFRKQGLVGRTGATITLKVPGASSAELVATSGDNNISVGVAATTFSTNAILLTSDYDKACGNASQVVMRSPVRLI